MLRGGHVRLSDFSVDDVEKTVTEPDAEAAAAEKAARRARQREEWLAKRKAAEAEEAANSREPTPIEKALDLALTPTYIAVGGAIIIYRKVRRLPPVTVDDYE